MNNIKTFIRKIIKHIISVKYKIILIALICTLYSCNKNPLKVDISGIEVDISIERFEMDLYRLKNTTKPDTTLTKMAKKYQPFFDNYNQYIIQIGKFSNRNYLSRLKEFLNDTTIAKVYANCSEKYSDVSFFEKYLSRAFRYYKYYFPTFQIPRILTHISGFNESIIIDVGIISIGIDKYLGSEYNLYKQLGYYNYLRKKMTPNQIPIDIFLSIADYEIPKGKTTTLLDNMIYQGKIYYLLKAIFPEKQEYELLNYSKEQYFWCKQNEEEMWKYIAGNKHLFNTESKIITRYIQDGLFTKGFPNDAPARTGVWLGLQIIKSYVKNTRVKLPDLLRQTDYEFILRTSVYKPT